MELQNTLSLCRPAAPDFFKDYGALRFPSVGCGLEVIYYYTDFIDYNRGEDEMDGMTPVILKDNKVIGWGRKILDDTDYRQTIRVERR
jgi:hypothetical protein